MSALDDITLEKFALVLLSEGIPEIARYTIANIIKRKRPEILLVMPYARPEEHDGSADAFSAIWIRS